LDKIGFTNGNCEEAKEANGDNKSEAGSELSATSGIEDQDDSDENMDIDDEEEKEVEDEEEE
jgi:hypothetical protein